MRPQLLLTKRFLLVILSIIFFCAPLSEANDDSLISSDLLNTLQNFNHNQQNKSVEKVKEPFSVTVIEKEGGLDFNFKLLNDAYIYEHSLKAQASNATIKTFIIKGKSHEHQDLQGKSKIFTQDFTVSVEILNSSSNAKISLEYQGCSKDGICFPPKTINAPFTQLITTQNDQNVSYTPLADALQQDLNQGFIAGLFLCLLLGMGLNLTPCVLPMLPVFSAMITGGNQSSKKETILRSLSYALGLSIAYMLLGLILSLIGAKAQAFFQHPLVIFTIAFILILCALNCAGLVGGNLIENLSSKLQAKLNFKQAHSLKGAFFLGLISALIATPCTSAPLAGAILFVTQDGKLLQGALSFFAIGFGMSLPLFIIGIFGRQLFMKAGRFSELIKELIAIPLFLAAIYLTRNFYQEQNLWVISLSTGLCVAYLSFIVLKYLSAKNLTLRNIFSGIVFVVSTVFTLLVLPQEVKGVNYFTNLTKLQDLEAYKQSTKPLLIDFTASWCTNCHAMDKEIFTQDFMQNLCESKFHCLRFDVSDMQSENNQALVDYFKIIGVPFIAILDNKLNPLIKNTGYLTEEEFKTLIAPF